MTISLHTLPKRHGRRSRRIGRGHGSGRGTYAGRGIKGQRSRTGGRRGIIRRALTRTFSKLPKQRGFQTDRPKYATVTLAQLNQLFRADEMVTAAELTRRGINVRGMRGVKVLGTGIIEKPLNVRLHAFSASAKKAILAAGGKVTVVSER